MSSLRIARRAGEAVLIGTDIRVEVYGVTRNQVRLMITAPRTTRILREELEPRLDQPPLPPDTDMP